MLCIAIVFVFNLLLLPSDSASYPSCTNSRAPLKLKNPLKFCPHNETVCCDSAEDLRLQKQFEAMNISDPQCASLVKSIICSVCDPFSAHIFNAVSSSGSMPLICNSSVSEEFHQLNDKISTDFCRKIWETCRNAPFSNPRFSASEKQRVRTQHDSLPSLQMDHPWPSNKPFHEAFVGASDDGAFPLSGERVSLNAAEAPEPPAGVCLEKIGNGNYISMVPHPDGSNRVFVHNLQGKIWLATIPEEVSKRHLQVDETKPFLDITDKVLFDTEFGMVSMVFHPNFVQNGRFFVSYYCDKMKQPNCIGRCGCNTDVNCDPSKITADNGIQPCQYHAVVAEYTTNGTSSRPRLAKRANPSEVRRILTVGLPTRGVHGGQILISPGDGCLYFMLGDNGRGADRRSFAQDKGSILGKILRLDIDHIPSAKEVHDRGLWGNYSIPPDNPYVNDKKLAPEIWALGLRLPWRCSFDSKRPSYFFCGDCGEDQYEEVDFIIKGGNYGWPVYEGPYLFEPEKTPGGNTTASAISPIFPVMGYNHSEANKNMGSASVSGGFFYRSTTDPCMYGRYLYMDLYAGSMWSAVESPENSGKFISSNMDFSCAHDSPMQCQSIAGSNNMPALGYVSSFAQDNRKDIYFLTSSGEYRVTRPSRCSYQCSKQSFATNKPLSSAAICGQLWTDVQLYINFAFNVLLLLDFI